MKITALIAQHLIDVHTGNNWTDVNLSTVLKDVTVKEAFTVTQASPNSIAALLHHITYWNYLMIERINGVEVVINESNGFNVPLISEEKEWQQLKDDNIVSANKLATAIYQVDDSRLEDLILPGYSTVYKSLQGTVEHIHYHLGQIVIIKNLLKKGGSQ